MAISAIVSLHFRMIYVSIDCFRFSYRIYRSSEEEKLSTILFRHSKASAKLCRKNIFFTISMKLFSIFFNKMFPIRRQECRAHFFGKQYHQAHVKGHDLFMLVSWKKERRKKKAKNKQTRSNKINHFARKESKQKKIQWNE